MFKGTLKLFVVKNTKFHDFHGKLIKQHIIYWIAHNMCSVKQFGYNAFL